MENYERICLCALNRIFGYNPIVGLRLLERFGSAERIFRAGRTELAAVMGFNSKYLDDITPAAVDQAGMELEKLARDGCVFISERDEGYPVPLKECEDHPIGLYCKSTSPQQSLFNGRTFISIVGTRDISPYGREWCGKIVESLAGSTVKPVIVSGLAMGTDICAHMAALECGLSTIAVMATGIDDVYPYRHRAHAKRICGHEGSSLVSDYPPRTAPIAINFLRRNRIIAGLSSATILVESRNRGGGMLTARLAFSYNRDVFALPGRIDDSRSEGCNSLIDNNVAKPICRLDSLVRHLGLGECRPAGKIDLKTFMLDRYSASLGEEDSLLAVAIAEKVGERRGISFDELCEELSKPYSSICRLANMMENDGIISTDLLQRCCLKVKNV